MSDVAICESGGDAGDRDAGHPDARCRVSGEGGARRAAAGLEGTVRGGPCPGFAGAGSRDQRSFSELSPMSARTKEMIQKRMTTWLSVQPIISK